LAYIFHFYDLPGKKLKIKPKSTKVEEFSVKDLVKSKLIKEDSQRPYEFLSDHYGVSCIIEYN